MSDTVNHTPHLNRARVKATALEIAGLTRVNGFGKPRFSRVGMSFLERIEGAARAAIDREVKAHPSVGKTLL